MTGPFWRFASASLPLRPLVEAWVHCRRHKREIGHWPNPVRPRSFNDRIVHRLIFTRDPLHARVSDKLALRDVVRARMGEDLCVPLLGTWADAGGLARAWDSLPRTFMLKPNHASGWFHVIRDRDAADRDFAIGMARWWLENSFYERSREWAYRRIRPCLLAEPLLPAPPGEDTPRNFRCFVFGGRLAFLRVQGVRGGRDLEANCDAAGRRLPVHINNAPAEPIDPPPPEEMRRLAALAERLAAGMDFMRVDLYSAEGRLWVGELTPFPNAGALACHPQEYDAWLGALWRAGLRGEPFPPPPG